MRAVVVHFSAVSLLFSVAAVFLARLEDLPRQVPTGNAWLMLLGVGLTATVGQLFLTQAFAAGTPSKVAVVSLTQIVFAIGLDVLSSDRSFTPAALLGMVLVMAPTAWVMAATAGAQAHP